MPPPEIRLDPAHFKLIEDFDDRFPAGAPSLAECSRLQIDGDVAFGADVKMIGAVHIRNPAGGQLVIPDGSLLEGGS